ncbi:MAG: acetyl-CoA C-acyltransferase, partial [Desulfotomaculaceae bacterium]
MPAWDRVVVVSKARLPMGKFGGSLRDFTVHELGAMVIREVLNRAGLEAEQVDEVIMGHCRQAGTGANPARKAAILAGIPPRVPSVTINKACPASLKATIFGAESILAEENKVVIIGGMESMSNIPH